MVQRPGKFNVFEFAVLSGLRAGQLSQGCTPRVTPNGNVAATAQAEVAQGKVIRADIQGEHRELVPLGR